MKRTNIKLRNLVIYQIYVRNFSKAGNFKAVKEELDRIKELGADVIYLLPIHTIGVLGKKGSLGCPYSIRDYRSICEELGTLSDFKELIGEIHKRKMKIMMDVVFNHTSKDSVLLQEHPEYFLKNESGEFVSKVADWSDVTDFDFTADKGLWEELSDILVEYSKMGIDAYRCDVASFVPIDFWKLARKKVARVNRNTFWLSESVHGGFTKYIRDLGYYCASESEVYDVFDIAYDYDIETYYQDYLKGVGPFRDYLEGVKRQEEIYPANYVKMKNLENHDCTRIATYVDNDLDKIKNWTALNYFQKGAVMLYAGEEYCSDILPSLFERELFNKNFDISDFIKQLSKMKKNSIFSKGIFTVNIPSVDGLAYNVVENSKYKYVGIFNVGQVEGEIEVDIPKGKYRNCLSGKLVSVNENKIKLMKDPIIIKLKKE